jgi:hypothetical protein
MIRGKCGIALSASLLFCLFSAHEAGAQTQNSYPMLMSLRPVAAQIGRSSIHEVRARYNLAGASQVLVSGDGVLGEVVPNESAKPEDALRNDVANSQCKVRFTVAADALPGVRDYRVMTPHGVSTVGQLVIARDPLVVEAPENDTVDKAQKIDIPCTLCGAIEKVEDVDYFRFHAPAGMSLTFHVRSQRLLNRLHDMQSRIDPLISIRNEQGAMVAANDNYYAGDPLLHHTFAQSGDYLLEVRDVRYQGNGDWTYAIEIHGRPYVTQVLPTAIQKGVATTISLIGYQLPTGSEASLLVPTPSDAEFCQFAPTLRDQPLNEITVWAVDVPVQRESDQAATKIADACEGHSSQFDVAVLPEITWPGVIAGCIGNDGEIDRFTFAARVGEKISAQVFARRGGSELDPILRILNAQGLPLAEVDDGTYERVTQSDSWLENWTVPADGKYVLEIRDLHQRGGEQFPYAVQIRRAEPYFQLEVDTDKTLLAPGMGSAFFVRALHKNGFAGEIELGVEGLPSGVSAIPGRVLADGTDGCVVLLAGADAAHSVANVTIFGTSELARSDGVSQQVRVPARPLQEYYSPGGGRGNYPVDTHAVSIANPMDIRSIRLSTSAVELTPGDSRRIDVTIERAPDYKGNVTLDVIMQHLEQHYGNTLPKGVKVDVAASKTLLTGDDTSGYITLVAADDAPIVQRQIVPVLAHVSINFVMKHTFCVEPLTISIVK